MTRDEHIIHLFRKYLIGAYTQDELDELLRYFKLEEASNQLTQLVEQALADPALDAMHSERVRAIQDKVARQLPVSHHRPRQILRWLPYAAAVVFLLAIGWWMVDNRWSSLPQQTVDIAPGGNRATLTLADGQTIDLSEAQSGIIVGDEFTYLDGTKVLRTGEDTFDTHSGHASYAILHTPKGGTYQVTLSDGTQVWLNAASTLKYPSRFDGAERVVELTGEAYFDVSKQRSTGNDASLQGKRIPFKVITNGQTIEVLGTEFNVFAYSDEHATKTTLIEGKVKVSDRILSPGEQAITREGQTVVKQVDAAAAIAWKGGKFNFNEQTLETIMRQIARWYDVEISYDGVNIKEQYWGSVSRFSNIKQVLTKLEQAGDLRFTIKERRIIVSKTNTN